MRGLMFSGRFSTSGSASQPSWKSTRQTLSGCMCSSTLWLRWNGGSNQNQRSAGRSIGILMSAIRKRSRKTRPLLSWPINWRTDEREPSQPTSQSASIW